MTDPENNKVPICRDCRYYNEKLCYRSRNIITGGGMNCIPFRFDEENGCGIKGKYFEPATKITDFNATMLKFTSVGLIATGVLLLVLAFVILSL